MTEEWKSSLTKLEQLKAVRDYVDENPVNFTVNGETESDEQTFIRYYNLMNEMLPDLFAAADKLRVMVDVFNKKEIDPFAAFAAIEQARGVLERLE